MTKVDRRVLWVFFVLGAVFATGLAARFLVATDSIKLALLTWQQLLFIVGGYFGSRSEVKKRPQLKKVVQGFLSGAVLFMVNTLMGALTLKIAKLFVDHQVLQHLILRERAAIEALLTSNKPLVVTGVMCLLVLGAPLGEELFFRGLLVDLWTERLGKVKAVLLSALLFALLHFYVLQFIPVLVSGVLLGLLFVCSRNIYVPVIAHAIVNGLVLLVWLANL